MKCYYYYYYYYYLTHGRQRKIDNISVRQTYRWKARFVRFLATYAVSTSTSGFMRNSQKRNACSAHTRILQQQTSSPCCQNSPCRGCNMHTVFLLIKASSHGIVLYKPRASITGNTVFMNRCQQRTAHGANCVSATHAATRRYAYAKIQYVHQRKHGIYPSKIQYIRYLSSSLHGSPPLADVRDAALFPNYFGQTCLLVFTFSRSLHSFISHVSSRWNWKGTDRSRTSMPRTSDYPTVILNPR